MQKIYNTQSVPLSPINSGGSRGTIPPPQLPQQPQITVLGSKFNSQEFKQLNQQPKNQIQAQPLNGNMNQPPQIYLTQQIQYKLQGQPNGNIQYLQNGDVNSNLTGSQNNTNTMTYKIKNTIQDMNQNQVNQQTSVPQIRNRFMNVVPGNPQGSVIYSQPQQLNDNIRSLSSNAVVNSNNFYNNQNSNNLLNSTNSNSVVLYNQHFNQNQTRSSVGSVSGVPYGQSLSPLPHIPIQSKVIDPINETILKHENKLKEILSTKNIQSAKEQNLDLCQSQGGNMYLSSQSDPQKYQRIYMVDNKIKVSPKKTIFKTVVTYHNQPQFQQKLIISSRQSPASSADSRSSLPHVIKPIQYIQDKQHSDIIKPIQIVERANELNFNQMNQNNNNNTSSSFVIQSPHNYNGLSDYELKKSQAPSNANSSPPTQQKSSQYLSQQQVPQIQPLLKQSQNYPQSIIFQQQKEQKPLTEIQKLYLERASSQEQNKQSPTVTFAQLSNSNQSRKDSNSVDFQLNPQNGLINTQNLQLSHPIQINNQYYQQQKSSSGSLSPYQITNFKNGNNPEDKLQSSQSNNLSSTQVNTSKGQNTLTNLNNNPYTNYLVPKSLEQSNSSNQATQISNNYTALKRPSVPQMNINTTLAPLAINSQISPAIQSPTIQSPINIIYQSSQIEDKVKKTFLYKLNPPGQQSPQSSTTNLNQPDLQNMNNTVQPSSHTATPQKQNYMLQSVGNQNPHISFAPNQNQAPQSYPNCVNQSPIASNAEQGLNNPDLPKTPTTQNQIQQLKLSNSGGISLLNTPNNNQSQNLQQNQQQLLNMSSIPPYTPLLYPTYNGIESPLHNLNIVSQRNFLSRQPSQEQIRHSSHSPAKSVSSEIGKPVYPQSPYTVIENQINQLRNQSRNNSQENTRNASPSHNASTISDQNRPITLSQNTQINGQLIQPYQQQTTAKVNPPIISNIISQSPEGVRTQKIQVQHTASIPLAGGLQLNTQVTTEHEVKDVPISNAQNILKNSFQESMNIADNVLVDNQPQFQNSFTQNPNPIFTFQTYSSPFPQANQNHLSYNFPNLQQNGLNQQNIFTNSPVRNQPDQNNYSNSFQQQDLQKIVGQFDSEGDQYQEIINQIGQQPRQENSKEGGSFLSNHPSLEQYNLGQPLSGQTYLPNGLNQSSRYPGQNKANQPNQGNIYISDPVLLTSQAPIQDLKPNGEENRKRTFSFQDGSKQQGVKDVNVEQQQGQIISENIDRLIGNIFKDAMFNVNQNINNKRNQLNQQVSSQTQQQQQQQQLQRQKNSSDEESLQKQSNQPQQQMQQSQQNYQEYYDQVLEPQSSRSSEVDRNHQMQNQIDQHDQLPQTLRQQGNTQQSLQYQQQPVQKFDETQQIDKQGNQQKQPPYVQKNLNTIDELDNDAFSVFKKIENGNSMHVPMNDSQKKELALSWQKPDHVQQLMMEQLNQDKKQLKSIGSKTNLGNSLTQFSKPIAKTSSNSMKQSDSYSMLPRSRESSAGVEKKDDFNSDFFRVKRFSSNFQKEKSEQQFSLPPQAEQKLSVSPHLTDSQIIKQKLNNLLSKQSSSEKIYPFFQPVQPNIPRNKSSSIHNSRQTSAEKQRSIVERIENTFEDPHHQLADDKSSFSFQQQNPVLQSDDKRKKNKKSTSQFQQPYPSSQSKNSDSNKYFSPIRQEIQNLQNRQEQFIDEPQYLRQTPQEQPLNIQENIEPEVILIPDYEESEKDRKYREFLLKMLNNYQEKREEILNKIDKLNKKQQGEVYVSSRKSNSNIPPQKLTYITQHAENNQGLEQSQKKRQSSQIISDSSKKLPKKKFELNNYMGYAFSENENQEQIQQFEMLRQNDPGSPSNAKRNQDALVNSLSNSSGDHQSQKHNRHSYQTNQEEFEQLGYTQSISKGRKLRTCELQSILDEKQKSNSPNKNPSTYKHDYYQSAKFKQSPPPPKKQTSNDYSPNSKSSSQTPKSRQTNTNQLKQNINQQHNQIKKRNSGDSTNSNVSNKFQTKSPNRAQVLDNKSKTANKNNQQQRSNQPQKEQMTRQQLENSSLIKQNNQKKDQSKLVKKGSSPINEKGDENVKKSKNIKQQPVEKNQQIKKGRIQQKAQSYQFDEQSSETMNISNNSENIVPLTYQQNPSNNRAHQKLNVLPSNTFESQNYISKDESQISLQMNQMKQHFSKPTSSHISKIKSKPQVQKQTSKSPQGKKVQQPKQTYQTQQQKFISQKIEEQPCNSQSNDDKKRKSSPQNIIQNISDMQKYSDYMVANNQSTALK